MQNFIEPSFESFKKTATSSRILYSKKMLFLLFDFFSDFFICPKKDQPKEITQNLAEWLLTSRVFAWLFASKAEPYYQYKSGNGNRSEVIEVAMNNWSTGSSGERILRRKIMPEAKNHVIIYKKPELTGMVSVKQQKFRKSYRRRIKEEFLVTNYLFFKCNLPYFIFLNNL